MERSVWTDERLGDRFDTIDRRFDQVDRELADLRSEMVDGFASLRSEMRDGTNDLRSLTIRLHLGTLIPILGMIAALIASGA